MPLQAVRPAERLVAPGALSVRRFRMGARLVPVELLERVKVYLTRAAIMAAAIPLAAVFRQ